MNNKLKTLSFKLNLKSNKRNLQKILLTWRNWCKEPLRNSKMRLKSETWWIQCLIKWQPKKSKTNWLQSNKTSTTKFSDYEK